MTLTRKRAIAGLILLGVAGLLVANEVRLLLADAEYDWYLRLQNWIAAVGTLAIYTFLYRENPFYRAFEHILLGVATGMGCAVIVRQQLIDKWLVPMLDGWRLWWRDGLSSEALGGVLLIVPGIVGLMWYFQYSKRWFWVSRITFCITLGAGVGLGFKDTFNQLLPQIIETFKPLWVGPRIAPHLSMAARAGASIENIVFVVGTVSVLMYFFFVFDRKHVAVKGPAQLGRWYLMVALGAFFGNTFMTRLSALIERVHFLVNEWLRLTG
jgi:hypothetical protein